MNDSEMDRIYRNLPREKIPWNIEEPPAALVGLVEGGKVRPCRAIDLGCGTGHYAVYLSTMGFDVTGIDISPAAIEIARENAEIKGAKCDFIVADVLGDLAGIEATFDFAYDWELLHHIYPENREKYVENVHGLLNPEGRYLSVCFSARDAQFGGSGKYRKTPLGTVLYFSSEEELRELFERRFTLIELKTIELAGKAAPHRANYAFMTKK